MGLHACSAQRLQQFAQRFLAGAQHDGGRAVGQALKDAVRAATGLSCSVGITPNKLLSKICSDLDKPDGLTVLAADGLEARIWPLPAKKVNGIGPKATGKRAALGPATEGEIQTRRGRRVILGDDRAKI